MQTTCVDRKVGLIVQAKAVQLHAVILLMQKKYILPTCAPSSLSVA